VVATTTMTNHPELSRRDLELLRLLAGGLSLESVSRRLDLSERTVRRRLRALCDRLGLDTPIEAIVWAVRHGLL
jgi:DNA-binding NarL/FixJ family response regulator